MTGAERPTAAVIGVTVTWMSPQPLQPTPLTAVLFPGQGSSTAQSRPLIERRAPELLERAQALLGSDPLERADESTRFAQPAIFIASLAGWRQFQLDDGPHAPDQLIFAGHSLGELSALAAAGVIAPDDALELVVLRAALMDESGTAAGDGGMLALLKATIEQAEQLADAHDVVVANDNAPGQVVLSGNNDRLAEAAKDARTQQLRSIALGVSGAFHSPAMDDARERFAAALANTTLHEPNFRVISSATTAPFVDVRKELELGLVRRVRWRETMSVLQAAGATRFADIGPDRVLAKLVTRNLGEDALVLEECDVSVA